jgi:hypothetical protein
MKDGEWNNENSARSVFWTVVAIAAVVLAFIIVIASLATPAHAQQPVSVIAPPVPTGDGVTASVTMADASTDGPSAFEAAIGIALALLAIGVLVWCIIDQRRGGR